MGELIKHDCTVEGLMMIEANKPCNWCDELDNIKEVKLEKEEDL